MTTIIVTDPTTGEEITFTGVDAADVDAQIDEYFGITEADEQDRRDEHPGDRR